MVLQLIGSTRHPRHASRHGDLPTDATRFERPLTRFLISCHFAALSDQGSPVSTPYCFNVASTWAHRRLLLGAFFAAR